MGDTCLSELQAEYPVGTLVVVWHHEVGDDTGTVAKVRVPVYRDGPEPYVGVTVWPGYVPLRLVRAVPWPGHMGTLNTTWCDQHKLPYDVVNHLHCLVGDYMVWSPQD